MNHSFTQRTRASTATQQGAIDLGAAAITAIILLSLLGLIYVLGDPYKATHSATSNETIADRLAPIGHVALDPNAPPLAAPVAPAATPVAAAPVAAPPPPPAAPVVVTSPPQPLPFAPAPGQARPTIPVLPVVPAPQSAPVVEKPQPTTVVVETPAAPPPVAVTPQFQMQAPPPVMYFRPQPSWMPHNAPLPPYHYGR
ncbi:hypothetical protein [Thiospirillum jenense]|uniref:Uncharacterized protein n=1 Tax=Thiospirillum jenense TaxID=1653858 RepID=A0A839HBS6_9GAMM|nr:hypothetical protein [Thiospirillum jenense]MBB1124886.1 hypothetical protein [Thiospirillum jenense]